MGRDRIALMTSINKARTSIIYKVYDLTPEMYRILLAACEKQPHVSVELCDADDEILMGLDFKVALPLNVYSHANLFIFPLLNFVETFDSATPGTIETVRVYSFDVDPEELAEIDHVKFTVVKK